MFLKYIFTINTLKTYHFFLKFVVTPTCFGPSRPSSGIVVFLVLKLLVFNTRNITLPEDGPEGPKHVGVTTNFKQSDMF